MFKKSWKNQFEEDEICEEERKKKHSVKIWKIVLCSRFYVKSKFHVKFQWQNNWKNFHSVWQNQEKINNLSLKKTKMMKKHEDMSASKILRFLNLKKICSFLPSSTLPPFFEKTKYYYLYKRKNDSTSSLCGHHFLNSLFWWYFWENIKVQNKKKLWSFHYNHMKNFCCLFAFFVDKTNKILHIIRSLQNHFFQRKHCSKKNNYLDCTLDWEKSWIIITLMINIKSVLSNSLNCIKT